MKKRKKKTNQIHKKSKQKSTHNIKKTKNPSLFSGLMNEANQNNSEQIAKKQ